MNTSGKHMFINGKIFTSDDSRPYADSMIIENGVVTWIGEQADIPKEYLPLPVAESCAAEPCAAEPCAAEQQVIEQYAAEQAGRLSEMGQADGSFAAEGTQITDLKGRRVIPGFVDAHMHPVMLADYRKKITIMPPEINSIEELIQAVRERRQLQGPGQWIEGWGYDEQGLAEKRSPNRYDLDAGCSDAPVSIVRTCAHIRCVNSMALKLAGIDRNTPDPPGGEIERDEQGEPTGILKENARNLIAPLLPKESKEQQVQNLLELGEVLTAQGITAICDMGSLDGSDNLPVYEAAAEKGFRQRTGVYYMWDFFRDDEQFSIPKEKLDRSQPVFVAGLKLIGDGSVSGRTAWMDKPYFDTEDEYGISVCSDDLIESAIDFCKKNQCQLSMHAMGGRAIARVVDRAAKEQPWTPEGIPYVRIEHITDPSEESIRKAAAQGISFVTKPIFLYAEIASYLKNLGREWMQQCYPVKHLLDEGVCLGFSTDAPATFWADPSDPFPGLKMAVTRIAADGTDCGFGQAVDIQTAIKLYTRGAALAAGFPGIGMLAPGYRADFAVLDRDILEIPPKEIDKVKVQETWIGGECVYTRPSVKSK